MRIYAWTFNVRKKWVQTGEFKENGKPRFKEVYQVNEIFPKVIYNGKIKKIHVIFEEGKKLKHKSKFLRHEIKFDGDSAEELHNNAQIRAFIKVGDLLCKPKNLMGVVICVRNGDYAISVCSAYEKKFSLAAGVKMASTRLEGLKVRNERQYRKDQKNAKIKKGN